MSTPENKNVDFIDVPEPLFKYTGESVIHEQNLAILSIHEDAILLHKKVVQKHKEDLKRITERLDAHYVESKLSALDALSKEYGNLKINYNIVLEYMRELSDLFYQDDCPTLFIAIIAIRVYAIIQEMRNDAKDLKKEILSQKDELKPFRKDIQRRKKLQQRLQSHYAAVEDMKKEKILQEGMSQEAQIISEQMQQTLARLGHMFKYTVGKQHRVDYVQFDHVIATPDQLQFKIKASRRGFFGGSIDMLPQGVFVTDLLTNKVLSELSIALEREVWSPHTSDDNVPLVNGAWIIVERLGLVEGIPRDVTYKQLMARYETADHESIPIPAGLKRGRRINWLHLDSPQGIHLMFTGISGSGKSNIMRACIAAVVEKQEPMKVNFVFIDLKKQGDFREFETAPHCIRHEGKGILTEIDDVVEVLLRVRHEMHMRQTKIAHIANNLVDYNRRVQPENRMPKIVVVFDEYANTRRSRFDEQAKIIDDIMIEIGQVGRASGISMWIGIQQPRRDNMPSALRDNVTTQFVGHQANVGAAQSATGNRESLKLEDIPGRMSANIGWKTEKVQMPFIPDEDVKLAVQFARDQWGEKNPYILREIDDDTAQLARVSDEDLVLKTALEEWQGDLKASRIHKTLRGQLSRPRITDVIKEIAAQEYIEFLGENFRVEKQPGNFYTLVHTDEESSDYNDYQRDSA